jgi:hypothetical protein
MSVQTARAVALLAFGLFGGTATAQAGAEGNDMKLEDVGFVMRSANTPAQIARLRLLPPRTFVGRTKNGSRYYIYADPDYCKCVFLGNELAMKNYRDLVSPALAPMPLGPDGGPVVGSLIQEIDPGIPIVDGDFLDYPD